MKKLLYICMMIPMLLGIVGCKDEPKPHDYTEAFRFDNDIYYISSDAQDVDLILTEWMSPTTTLPLPTQWDRYGAAARLLLDIGEDQSRDELLGSQYWGNGGNVWKNELLECEEFHDSMGRLVIRVQVPANNTEYYRGIEVEAFDGLDFAHAYIIQSPKSKEEKAVMQIRVDNQIYSSEYELDDEGNYHYADDGFAAMINRLQADDNVEMVIIESGIVDYIYKNRTDLDEYLRMLAKNAGMKYSSDPTTRAGAQDGFRYMTDTDLGYFAVFGDAQFCDKDRHAGYDNYCYAYTLHNLKIWGMNDIISSLAVGYNGSNQDVCAILTVWDDADFNYGDNDRSKHRMSVIASYWNRKVSIANLKDVKCKNSSKSWNDRMSCISGHFGYWGKSMLDY